MRSKNLTIDQPEANKARLDNRWGCSVGHAFRNFNPPSRFKALPRPSGASASTLGHIIMNTFTKGSLKLGSVFGALVGFVYYGAADENATSGGIFLESVTTGISVMLIVSGCMIGLRRIIVGRDQQIDNDDGIKDDPFGLDRGVTAKSIGGAFIQSLLRTCRDCMKGSDDGPNKSS